MRSLMEDGGWEEEAVQESLKKQVDGEGKRRGAVLWSQFLPCYVLNGSMLRQREAERAMYSRFTYEKSLFQLPPPSRAQAVTTATRLNLHPLTHERHIKAVSLHVFLNLSIRTVVWVMDPIRLRLRVLTHRCVWMCVYMRVFVCTSRRCSIDLGGQSMLLSCGCHFTATANPIPTMHHAPSLA